jgi:hypothetical protein
MAAFTTLALLGLAAAGGGAAAKALKNKNKNKTDFVSAPAPVPTPAAPAQPALPALEPPTPLDATRARSDATMQAQLAAKKQRKRAAGGGVGRTMLTGGASAPTANLQPRTLIGGSY